MLETISAEDFKNKLDTNEYVLIDVRTQAEHDQKKIAESEVIDVYEPDFMEKMTSLDKDKKYLIYCLSGARSGQVLGIMSQMGFKEVYDLSGGIADWRY